MAPRYYAAVVRNNGSMMLPPNGPYVDYDEAIHVHARSAAHKGHKMKEEL